MLSIDQLIAIASDIRIDSKSELEKTRQVYNNHVEHFAAFLTARGIEDAILPLNPMYVEAWITELFTKNSCQYASICQKIAALRSYSREQGVYDVSALDYNMTTGKTRFCLFMTGLRRKLLKLPVQKAEAISTSLIHQLIHHVLRNEKHQYTRSRDVCILALGFLHGLRACDIACVNFDEVQFWLDACGNDQSSVIVRYGKTTHEESQVYLIDHEGLTFDQVGILREHVNTTSELYQNHVLTSDGKGAKLFVNIVPQTGVIKDHRISNCIVTKMLRQRLTQHFRATDPSMTGSDIDKLVSRYSSHSLKRGAISAAASNGATDLELQALFRFKNQKTPKEYVDLDTLSQRADNKKPRL